MKSRLFFPIAFSALYVSSAFGQAPPSLTVKSATSAQVQLSWSVSDGTQTFTVQRKSGGDYSTIATITGTTATDLSIDPYTIYNYRVVAANTSGSPSPSNEVTVGPPPAGFNLALAGPPSDSAAASLFGAALRMVLDSNGDPALAFIIRDPNLDGDFSDGTLNFVSWNRAQYKWNAPVPIATVGDTTGNSTLVPMSLARDTSTNTFGLAYEVENPAGSRIDIALSSDGGATWNIQTVTSDPAAGSLEEPSLGMAKSQVHVAFWHAHDGIRYVNGKATDDAKTWNSQLVPLPGGFTDVRIEVSLSIDGAGNPGIAFIAIGDSTTAEAFWRPGGSAVVAADNNGHQTDDPDVQLSFYGTQPRIAFTGSRDDQFFSDFGHDLWAARAGDDGGSWLPMVNPPSDGNRSMNGPISIASGSRGQAVIVTESNSGNQDGVKCGVPKMARSNDLLTWTTCGIAPVANPSFTGDYPVVRFGGNDKLWISFRNSDVTADLPSGIFVWREP